MVGESYPEAVITDDLMVMVTLDPMVTGGS